MDEANVSQPNELEKLKSEILKEIQLKKSKKELTWGGGVVTILLLLLTVISVASAVQSVNVLNKINSESIRPAATGGSDNTSLPSNLQNLPGMVGGC